MNITRSTLMRGAAAAALSFTVSYSKEPEAKPAPAAGNAPASGSAARVLRFSAIPNQNATELKAKFDPVAAHLAKELGIAVEFFPSADYKASVEAFLNGQVQLAWFGGVTGVQARAKVPGAKAIVQGKEDTAFKSYFIANKDSGLEKSDAFPSAIAGMKFAFGSESSTSGRVMPSWYIKQNSGKSEKDFFTQPVIFTGSHDKTIEAVSNGTVQVGVCDYSLYDKLVKEGKVDPAAVKVIWVTPEFQDYNFTVHPSVEQDFGAGFAEKLSKALLGMNTKAPALLKAFPREALIEAKNEDYKLVEDVCRELWSGALMAAYELENVTVKFGPVTAVSGLSLTAVQGQLAAIVGPSGGGKSTLLRLLTGAVLPAQGRVLADGVDFGSMTAAALRSRRAATGFIHQHGGLVPNIRVAANLACGRLGCSGLLSGLRQVVMPSRREKVEMLKLLARVGLEDRLYSRVDHLSGGQQQRVAIARALWQEPQALLADEPVSSLDPARARDVLRLLTGICREDGLTLLVSLHQFELAREFFPRLIGLRAGRVVFDKPSGEVGAAEYAALYELGGEEIAV